MAMLCLAWVGGAAWAMGPTDVRLVTEACPAIDAARLEELVTLELGTVGAGPTLSRAVVVLVCDGGRIAITATEAQTGRQARSEVIAHGTFGPAVLRLLAISVSELVATSDAPPETRRSIVREPKPIPPSEPVHGFRISAAASLRRMARPATWLEGFTLSAELALARHFALAFEGRCEIGSTPASLTTVDWRVAGASLALLAGTGRGAWWLEAGSGVEVGIVQLSAHDTTVGAKGTSLAAPWAGPLGRLRVIRALGSRAFLTGRIEGGWVMQRVAGDASDGTPLVELRGGWAGLTIGAGVMF